ncbi:MAG: hypothetical protein AAF561_04110, partial [Planctomycetota bacterium]
DLVDLHPRAHIVSSRLRRPRRRSSPNPIRYSHRRLSWSIRVSHLKTMLRTLPLLVAAGLSLLVASATRGQQFSLIIDPQTGDTFIDTDLPFAGFTLASSTGDLLPDGLPYVGNTPTSGLILLDTDPFLALSTLSNTQFNISAGTVGQVIPPGTYELGPIVDVSSLNICAFCDGAQLSFLDDRNQVQPGWIGLCVPEPTTALCLAGGALLSLRRRTQSALGVAA